MISRPQYPLNVTWNVLSRVVCNLNHFGQSQSTAPNFGITEGDVISKRRTEGAILFPDNDFSLYACGALTLFYFATGNTIHFSTQQLESLCHGYSCNVIDKYKLLCSANANCYRGKYLQETFKKRLTRKPPWIWDLIFPFSDNSSPFSRN